MGTVPSLPTYEDITKILENNASKYNASQVHGLLCGFICATSGESIKSLEAFLFGSSKSQKNQALLRELYETSYHLLSEFSFEFNLLLPHDDADLKIRAEELGLWCQGFLTGLEQANFSIGQLPPGEMNDAVQDILEIAQLSYDDLTQNEEDESAYFELVEYVRLAVLLIFHELKSEKADRQNDEADTLH